MFAAAFLCGLLPFIDVHATSPLGASDRVALTCNKDNGRAMELYRKKGFAPTGAVFEEEVELALALRQ